MCGPNICAFCKLNHRWENGCTCPSFLVSCVSRSNRWSFSNCDPVRKSSVFTNEIALSGRHTTTRPFSVATTEIETREDLTRCLQGVEVREVIAQAHTPLLHESLRSRCALINNSTKLSSRKRPLGNGKTCRNSATLSIYREQLQGTKFDEVHQSSQNLVKHNRLAPPVIDASLMWNVRISALMVALTGTSSFSKGNQLD